MAVAAAMNVFRSALNPLRLDGKQLPKELVVIARGLALFQCLTRDIPARRHLPYLEFLDAIAFFDAIVLATAIAGGALIMISNRVRTGCLLMGLAYLAGLLAARPAQSVAHTYVACLFLMLAMSSHSAGTRLVRAQVIVLYLASALNKIVDVDWWNGRYFEAFLVQRHEKQLYIAVASLFPPMTLSIAMGVLIIVTEVALALLLLRPRLIPYGVVLATVFHASMAIFMGMTFGPFVTAMFLSFLAFIPWPAEETVGRRRALTIVLLLVMIASASAPLVMAGLVAMMIASIVFVQTALRAPRTSTSFAGATA
jgi:hypothetical protein